MHSAVNPTQDRPNLGHSVYGQGPEKVLVFHDWMGDSANYEPIIPYLDPGVHSYAFADARGYGLSRHLTGAYTVEEVAADAFHLASSLGWTRFHMLGHSMTGLVAQRMAVDDWMSGAKRLKSVVAVTPVSADGYPADEGTRKFLWDLIGRRDLSEQGFSMLTGQRLLAAWGRVKTIRHLQTSATAALKGYYRMWLETDFSAEARRVEVKTPFLVVGVAKTFQAFRRTTCARPSVSGIRTSSSRSSRMLAITRCTRRRSTWQA